MDEKAKKKTVTIEVLLEGPGGELYFQPVEADPEHLEELIAVTKNTMIKRNLEKQLEQLKKKKNEHETEHEEDPEQATH